MAAIASSGASSMEIFDASSLSADYGDGAAQRFTGGSRSARSSVESARHSAFSARAPARSRFAACPSISSPAALFRRNIARFASTISEAISTGDAQHGPTCGRILAFAGRCRSDWRLVSLIRSFFGQRKTGARRRRRRGSARRFVGSMGFGGRECAGFRRYRRRIDGHIISLPARRHGDWIVWH